MVKNEKEAKALSEAEQKRAERFARITEEMERQGYTRRDLTTDMSKANWFSGLLVAALLVVGFGLYYLIHHRLELSNINPLIFLVCLVALIVVHELIHGICWSVFAPRHFKDIEFGILKPSMTPYCTCLASLKKGQHIFGTVMPLIVLGIIPMIVGLAIGNGSVLLLGVIMAASAAGDILIIRNILAHKSSAREIVYMDHPTEVGVVAFERQ